MNIARAMTFASILAASGLSLAAPVRDEKAVDWVEEGMPDVSNKTGFFAQLSPEVGGGHMVWYRGGEMKYLSKESVLDVRDIKISKISYHYVVKVFPDPRSQKFLLEQSQSPQPYIFAIDFLLDGQIDWSRSLTEVLSEDWITVGVFDSEKEAEKLAERLRLEGRERPVTNEETPARNEAKQDGADQSTTTPELKLEANERSKLESKVRPR